MVQFAAGLLRNVTATFVGLLIAGGTLTLAADRAPIDRPTLVPAAPGQRMLTVPDVTGQAYVFAKGILQDHGLAWHVTGPVLGYAANTVFVQRPGAGSVVRDTGAPLVTLTLGHNPAYVEKGTPENDAPYAGTAIEIPANVPQHPETRISPALEPVQVPQAPASERDHDGSGTGAIPDDGVHRSRPGDVARDAGAAGTRDNRLARAHRANRHLQARQEACGVEPD